jgi:hypothetical protein
MSMETYELGQIGQSLFPAQQRDGLTPARVLERAGRGPCGSDSPFLVFSSVFFTFWQFSVGFRFSLFLFFFVFFRFFVFKFSVFNIFFKFEQISNFSIFKILAISNFERFLVFERF